MPKDIYKNAHLLSALTIKTGSFDTSYLGYLACRVDEEGKNINDHFMPQRAIDAANVVARKRGWKTTMDFRAYNMK